MAHFLKFPSAQISLTVVTGANPSVSDGPVLLCWLLHVEFLMSWEVPQALISTPNWCT